LIKVIQTGQADPLEFDVVVKDTDSEMKYHVTMSRDDYRNLTGETVPASRCIEAAFHFLLDREPKEAILKRFDVRVITQYFPEFEAEISSYIAAHD
jgi:hypothetical protein